MSSVDRISALTDDVLTHILSFLPTKTSVSTSILGRRWRFLWAYVPKLDFFCGDGVTNMSDIDRVMLRYKAKNINTFCLNISIYYLEREHDSDSQLEAWITTAIERNVRNLNLELSSVLPRLLFTCDTLVTLCLGYCRAFPSCDVIYLPALKELYLRDVEYEDFEALSRFLSGCSVLEKLIVEYITVVGNDCGYLDISSASITCLGISFGIAYGLSVYDYIVKLNAPALRYIQVYDRTIDHVSLSPATMASLIEAGIILDYDVIKFLDCLSNAKCLHLLSRHEMVDMFLVKLKCPKQVPACLLFHLSIITIHDIRCNEHEFNIVKYLLANGKVLERMDIHFGNGVSTDRKSDAVLKISLFERGSKACELAFY